jgi:hypothetical protein
VAVGEACRAAGCALSPPAAVEQAATLTAITAAAVSQAIRMLFPRINK